MPTALTKTFFTSLPGLPVLLLFIYSLTSIELTPTFLPLLKMAEVSRNIDIIFLHNFFANFFTHFLQILLHNFYLPVAGTCDCNTNHFDLFSLFYKKKKLYSSIWHTF